MEADLTIWRRRNRLALCKWDHDQPDGSPARSRETSAVACVGWPTGGWGGGVQILWSLYGNHMEFLWNPYGSICEQCAGNTPARRLSHACPTLDSDQFKATGPLDRTVSRCCRHPSQRKRGRWQASRWSRPAPNPLAPGASASQRARLQHIVHPHLERAVGHHDLVSVQSAWITCPPRRDRRTARHRLRSCPCRWSCPAGRQCCFAEGRKPAARPDSCCAPGNRLLQPRFARTR